MISPEERNSKPYAIPIQCMPCAGLKDNELRELLNKIVQEMTARSMKISGEFNIEFHNTVIEWLFPTGFTTNGEFNTLRAKGNT